ncbi:hypothetical protein B484DRAFT_414756, partial [Ochromonadaceae sp. CCMP2298]
MRSTRICGAVSRLLESPTAFTLAMQAAIQELSYKELQAKAKEYGIPANKKKDVLIEEILMRDKMKTGETVPTSPGKHTLTPHSLNKNKPKRALGMKTKSVQFVAGYVAPDNMGSKYRFSPVALPRSAEDLDPEIGSASHASPVPAMLLAGSTPPNEQCTMPVNAGSTPVGKNTPVTESPPPT